MRGATQNVPGKHKDAWISTHTPHAGRDNHVPERFTYFGDFYSHAPCGARPGIVRLCRHSLTFLLTRPMRGATALFIQFLTKTPISTHTPHAGRDKELEAL